MKTHLKLSALIGLMLCIAFPAAQAQMEATPGQLPLYGQLTSNGKKLKEGLVKIYDGNTLWKELETNKKGQFSIGLDLNKYYTLEFCSEGTMTKRITVNTELEKKKAAPVPFEAFVDLVPMEEFQGKDVSNLDFPIAIVTYNPKKRLFEPSLAYSMNMMKEYDKLTASEE
jgi:hypothetical protein